MTLAEAMDVTIRLPTRMLFEGRARKLFAVAENGAFGMLNNHIDFVTSLVPSVLILTLTLEDGHEQIFGIDEGILVKQGHKVDVAIRRGAPGTDLATLQESVRKNFIEVDEDERVARSALSRLEAGMVRRFADLQRPKP